MNYIDLFAGAGGLSEGFNEAGFEPVAHIEMNKDAADTLRTRACFYYLKNKGNLKPYLHLSQDEVWLMPFGLLLDLWECHRQYNGISKPKIELSIDDIIPSGI